MLNQRPILGLTMRLPPDAEVAPPFGNILISLVGESKKTAGILRVKRRLNPPETTRLGHKRAHR
jgi:hypothetical protein